MAAPAAQPAAPSADPPDAETSRPLTPRATARVVGRLTAAIAGQVLLTSVVLLFEVEDVVRRGEPVETRELLVLATLAWLPVLFVAVQQTRRLQRDMVEVAEQREQRHGQFLDVSSEWIWSIDNVRRFTSSNRVVEAMTGYTVDEVLGVDALAFIHPDYQEETERAAYAALGAGQGWSRWLLHWVHRDGHVLLLESTATPSLNGEGAVVGYRGAARDVTDEVARREAAAEQQQAAQERLGAVRTVLDHPDKLSIVFQPIVAADGLAVAGVEALARFTAPPVRGPDVWFAEAHTLGLGRELELLAIRLALDHAPDLPAGCYLSLNASPATLLDPALAVTLRQGVLGADRLVVELTEHAQVADYDQLAFALAPLRELGLRLAIDDAGAGYASLRHILQLRPDLVKLDRQLIDGLDRDPVRRSLVAAMVAFSREIGAELVAEGVERAEELETLRGIGVRYAQGYLLGRPAALVRGAAAPVPAQL